MLSASDRPSQENPMTAVETSPSALPGPRTAEPDPWLISGTARLSRTTRPRSEYWDVENARWTSRAVIPGLRQGD